MLCYACYACYAKLYHNVKPKKDLQFIGQLVLSFSFLYRYSQIESSMTEHLDEKIGSKDEVTTSYCRGWDLHHDILLLLAKQHCYNLACRWGGAVTLTFNHLGKSNNTKMPVKAQELLTIKVLLRAPFKSFCRTKYHSLLQWIPWSKKIKFMDWILQNPLTG